MRSSDKQHPGTLSRLTALVIVLVLLGGCGWGGDEVVALEKELSGARTLLESLNFNEAHPLYERIYGAITEEDPHWKEAAFGYASSLWHMTPPSEEKLRQARQIFSHLADVEPGTDWALAAKLNLARMEMLRDYPGDAENPAAAIPILQQVIDEGEGFIRHEAVLRLGECYRMDIGNPQSIERALELYRSWLEKYPSNPLASIMWVQTAWMELLHSGRKQQALEAFIRADQIGLNDPSKKAAILWRISRIAEELGDFDVAARFYRRVILEVPTTGRAYESRIALERIRETAPGMGNIQIPKPAIGGGP